MCEDEEEEDNGKGLTENDYNVLIDDLARAFQPELNNRKSVSIKVFDVYNGNVKRDIIFRGGEIGD